MEPVLIAGGDCGRGDCPSVFQVDDSMAQVQGYIVDKKTPAGEAIVEIPIQYLLEAARALGQ